MRKLITKNWETYLVSGSRIYPNDLPNNTQDIKLVGDQYIDLENLNLNIVKYDINDIGVLMSDIKNCNINKLILNLNGWDIKIYNSNIQNIYIKSKVGKLYLTNTPISNLHGRVHLINNIEIEQ